MTTIITIHTSWVKVLVRYMARDDKALEVNVTALEVDDPENVAGAFRQFPVTFYLAPGFDPQKPLE